MWAWMVLAGRQVGERPLGFHPLMASNEVISSGLTFKGLGSVDMRALLDEEEACTDAG